MATVTIKGGDKLQKALAEIAKNLKKASSLKVGFLENATYPGGMPVAAVAAIQNFGAPKVGIPPRPFFSNMVKEKSPAWPEAIALNLKSSNYDAEVTLKKMGEGIKGQLQESIINTLEPSLSPVTVMLRGMKSHDQSLVVNRTVVEQARQRVKDKKTNYGASTKPLIDTGHLLNSVESEVV